MRAGMLRQKITVQDFISIDSPTGANSEQSLFDVMTLPASIEPLSVRDVLSAQAVGSQARLRCIIRFRRDITSSMQVVYDGSNYKIDGNPLPDTNTGKEYMTLILVSA